MRFHIFSFVLVYFSLLVFSSKTVAQTAPIPTAQPTIMVIPFATEGQSLRSAYERNELTRIAVTKAKEAFDKRGINTIDLIAKLKQTNNNAALQDNQASETADEVIAISGADIYVVVEASKNVSKTGNSANVIMTAYDAFSSESLANKTGNSPLIYTDNFEKLVEKAIEPEIDNLLNTIQEKFTLIIENGRTIVVNVGIAEGDLLTLDEEVGPDGDLLSDVIEAWVESNAYKSQYHLQGVTNNKIIFDMVKIPLFDESGKNYRVTKFAAEFRKFLKTNAVDVKQIVQGNNVVFTLSKG